VFLSSAGDEESYMSATDCLSNASFSTVDSAGAMLAKQMGAAHYYPSAFARLYNIAKQMKPVAPLLPVDEKKENCAPESNEIE